MEVHAHTHTPRKKWTHYLWEFLMLFLAVFCGFLAENFRETLVEKERAKQYIQSFYTDLNNDTAIISNSLKDYEAKIEILKDRRSCYDSMKENKYSGNCMLDLFNSSAGFVDFINSD